jgi:hypothetical protein
MKIPNLLLIAGTGNKSGKTTFACRIIEQFRDKGIFGIKITPHFHETTAGLNMIVSKAGYSVYEETNGGTNKDTSRMLKAGAGRVFFAKVTDNELKNAFTEIMRFIPEGTPIVCESPALRHYVEPGLFVIMNSEAYNSKDISVLLSLSHVSIDLEGLQSMDVVPICFMENRWIYTPATGDL